MSKTSQTRRAAMVTSSALSPNSSAEPRQPWTAEQSSPTNGRPLPTESKALASVRPCCTTVDVS